MDLSKVGGSVSSIASGAKDNLPMAKEYLPMVQHYWWIGAILLGVVGVGFIVYFLFFRD